MALPSLVDAATGVASRAPAHAPSVGAGAAASVCPKGSPLLNSLLQFANAYPALISLLIVPFVTGGVNLGLEWFGVKHPRLVGAVKAAGFDPGGLVRALFAKKPPPTAPSSPYRTIPPPPPLPKEQRQSASPRLTLGGVLIAAGIALAAIVASVACAEVPQVITTAGAVCEVVLTVADPAVEPLCATAEEVALAIDELVQTHMKVSASGNVTPAPVQRDALYAKVVERRARASKDGGR